jgi:hypothetical protein
MVKAERPFLIVNPKSYLYGQKSLELAMAADRTAAETGLQILPAFRNFRVDGFVSARFIHNEVIIPQINDEYL